MAYFGVAKFVLRVIDIDGSQQFLTGFLAIHELALWNRTSIQNSVSVHLNANRIFS